MAAIDAAAKSPKEPLERACWVLPELPIRLEWER